MFRQPSSNPSSPVTHAILATVVASMLSGCTPYQLARRTLSHELAQYPRVTDGRLAGRVYRSWARQAWSECGADGAYSPDYRQGFEDGFVDLVFAGGDGEPPAIPPKRFWNIRYRSPEGDQALQDWMAGFRHGSSVARDGGYRQRTVVPSTAAVMPAEYEDALPGEFLVDAAVETNQAPALMGAEPVERPAAEPMTASGATSSEIENPSDLVPIIPDAEESLPLEIPPSNAEPSEKSAPTPGDVTLEDFTDKPLLSDVRRPESASGVPVPPWMAPSNQIADQDDPWAAEVPLDATENDVVSDDQVAPAEFKPVELEPVKRPEPRSEWRSARTHSTSEPLPVVDENARHPRSAPKVSRLQVTSGNSEEAINKDSVSLPILEAPKNSQSDDESATSSEADGWQPARSKQ